MQHKHVMVDLEFMSSRVDSAIVSIGAKVFDPLSYHTDGREFYVEVDLEDCEKLGMTFDASTVTWWLGQREKVREAATKGGRTPLLRSLSDLSDFLDYDGYAPEKVKLWCHAEVDSSRLRFAYVNSSSDLKVPWKRRNVVDLWTVKSLHNMLTGTEFVLPGRLSLTHNALADAKYQALCASLMCIEIYNSTGVKIQ